MSVEMWNNFPEDLVRTLGKFLESPIDFVRFRSVCSSWRSSVPPPTVKPVITVPHPSLPGSHCTLHETKIYRLSPAADNPNTVDVQGWLCRVGVADSTHAIVYNPLQLIHGMDIELQKTINLLNYRISDISDASVLYEEDGRALFFKRVIKLNLNSTFAVVVLDIVEETMSYWKPGDISWTSVDLHDYKVMDIILHDSVLYAISKLGNLLAFDSEFNWEVVGTDGNQPDSFEGMCTYLVSFVSDLYLVPFLMYADVDDGTAKDDMYMISDVDHNDEVVASDYSDEDEDEDEDEAYAPNKRLWKIVLKIYKWNSGANWEHVRDLGDKVLFLGHGLSFGVSTKDFAGCKGNCVWLSDLITTVKKDRDTTGLIDLEKKEALCMELAAESAKMFWPYPGWLV